MSTAKLREFRNKVEQLTKEFEAFERRGTLFHEIYVFLYEKGYFDDKVIDDGEYIIENSDDEAVKGDKEEE